LALGNACEVHFRKYSHKNYDQVIQKKKILISEIPRILQNKCPTYRISNFINSGEGVERKSHYLTRKPKQI
jgi:hypothetical protein